MENELNYLKFIQIVNFPISGTEPSGFFSASITLTISNVEVRNKI